jgi:hypothetical protein
MKHHRLVGTNFGEKPNRVSDQVRGFLEAAIGVALMGVMGIIGGFVAAGITGDSTMSVPVAVAAFVSTGALLIYRHLRALRRAARLRPE